MRHYAWTGRVAVVALGLGLMAITPGCYTLTITIASLENPTLTVGGSSRLIIEATTVPGRTLQYFARATRGRIVPENSTENKVLTYHAPFTSRAPDASGNMTNGDIIELQVSDGSTTVSQKLAANLSGSTMVFVDAANANGYGALKLATTDENGSQVSNVRALMDGAKNALRGASPTISPNGRMIAFVDYSTGTSNSAIRTVDAAGKLTTLVSAADSAGFNVDPTWSPFSSELVFASDRRGNYDLYRVSAQSENGAVAALTQTAQDERYPAWNPSFSSDRTGTLVASVRLNSPTGRADAPNAWNLFVIDVTSGQYLKQLTNLDDPRDYAVEPHWKVDGQTIAYTRSGPFQGTQADSQRYQRIYVQDTTQNAGSGKQLNGVEQSPTVFESNPMWNQMGTALAYVKAYTSPSVAAQTHTAITGNLWRQNVNGVNTVTEQPQQWQDFSATVPGLGYDDTMRRPLGGNGMAWF